MYTVCIHNVMQWHCSWYWVCDTLSVDTGNDRDVKAAPLPTVESADAEQNEEDSEDDEDKDKDEAGSKEKKKRVGFRDRKVGISAADSNLFNTNRFFIDELWQIQSQ